ncbi:MAG: DUF3108 domain-containing protein [Pseudomonadota bacterium]|nr:DUF3108 domain-containing protein [Pseudomonadota bacterium]
MKNVIGLAAIVTMLALAPPATARTEVISLHVGDKLARVALVRPGVHRYLRYTIKPDGARNAVDIWVRRVAFEPATGAGRRLHMTQRWDEVADKVVLIQDSWFTPGTLAPLTHVRHVERDGKTTIGGYQFTTGKVIGMADLPDNGRKDFTMPMPEPAFNFEYDMELLQALPMAAGRVFDIPFYDAGVDKEPDRYRFAVAGSDKIRDWSGRAVDCWLVTADYRTGKIVSRFWFAKQSQLLVREEAVQPDGTTLIKTLLPPESSDQGA